MKSDKQAMACMYHHGRQCQNAKFNIDDLKHFNTLSISTLSDTSNGVIGIDVAEILIEAGLNENLNSDRFLKLKNEEINT